MLDMLIERSAPTRTWRAFLSGLSNFPNRFRRTVSGGVYRPEIDGLRFFAISIVIFGHLFQRGVRFFPGFEAVADGSVAGRLLHLEPGLGVYLFFAISGFIIATQARKARVSPLSGDFLKAYFGRRILRIEPPYMILLVATWLLLTISGYQPEGTRQFFTEPQSINLSLLGSFFYAHDLLWGAFPRLFPPGWTLEVEVQFYILAPLLFWIWFRLKNARVRFVFALTVLFAGSLLSTFAPHQIGPFFTYYSILRYFPLFWLGIILADLRAWLTAAAEGLSPALLTIVGWLGLIDFLFLPDSSDSLLPGLWFWAAGDIAIIAMFVSAFAPRSGFRRFCAWPWISLIGGACYSLYLVHMQIIQTLSTLLAKLAPGLSFGGVLAAMLLQVVIVIVVGLTFYVVVERTFMMPKWHLSLLARLRNAARMLRPGQEPLPRSIGIKSTRSH
jgi:peptidoglycan/LPS O-acetylase OafA/YrhL